MVDSGKGKKKRVGKGRQREMLFSYRRKEARFRPKNKQQTTEVV